MNPFRVWREPLIRKYRNRIKTFQFCAERLEPRRLLAAQLSYNSAGGLLTFIQQSGVNDSLEVYVNAAHDWFFDDTASTVLIDSTLAGAGWVVTPDGHEALGPNLPQALSIIIDTNDGTDSVAIDGTSVPIIYQSSASPDITLTVGDGRAASNVEAPIYFDGAGTNSTLVVDDTSDPTPRTIDMTSGSITGLGSSSINVDSNVPDIILKPGTGGNTVTVDESSLGAPTEEVQSIGHDTVDVNSNPFPSSVNINGINNGSDDVTDFPQTDLGYVATSSVSGLSTITVDDSADTQARDIAYQPSGPIGTVTGFSKGTVLLDGGIASLLLKGGSGGNSWTIDPLSGYHAAVATVDTGAGNDSVMVNTVTADESLNINNDGGNDFVDVFDAADTVGTLGAGPTIIGPIDVTNTGGSMALKIDESAVSIPRTVTANGSRVSGLTTGTEQFSGIAAVSLIGSPAADSFSVTPSASTSFSINGGPFAPAAHPSDALNVNVAGLSLPVVSSSGTSNLSGSYTFADAQPVSFSNMGQIAPIIGTASGRVYDGQNLDPIVGAIVFADENGNGVEDPGEPATTTNGSGNYVLSDISVGNVNLIVNATPSASFATQSRSVLIAESVTTPADFELLPPAVANQPNLVGAFVGTAPAAALTGSKQKFKLKVINSGSVAAVGTPQVELFASADTSLDETDDSIATLSLGKIKLNPGASKILTGSFVYPSSLPAGTFFLLASVDSTNLIPESNESDNIAATSTAIRIAPAFVDLTGSFGPLAKIPRAGDAITLPLTIENVGNVPAKGTIDVGLFASADQALDASDQTLASNLPVRVNIKGGKSQKVSLHVPAGVTIAGDVFFIADLNSTRSFAESNYANNLVLSASVVSIG